MKKRILLVASIALAVVFALIINTKPTSVSEMDQKRAQHLEFLNNSPFKANKQLSKKERKAKGIPPSGYFERQYELTMDPSTGRPHPERLFEIQKDLEDYRVPGETSTAWVERGPNNVGGRTRAIMFDPNDATNKRVFAGGVSGGLWVNDDITDANTSWVEVDIPQNLAVSSITYDPNDTNTFYVGTGESYVFGDVNGNGLWKSSDAGLTWTNVFGGISGVTEFQTNAKLEINSPSSIAGEKAALMTTNFGVEITTPITADLILVDDATATVDDACEAITNDLTGKIAVLRRGTCSFSDKVQNAQNAGAIAVIVVNNTATPPIPMGGTSITITIPSVMVGQEVGNEIIAELNNNVNGTLRLSNSIYNNGTFVVPGVQHINDVKVRNNGGTSEIYVAAGESFYSDATPSAYLAGVDFGLYKSVDGGNNWVKLILPNSTGGNPLQPNDIEIAADNKVWVSTTNSVIYGDGGGQIISSPDGVTFTIKHSIAGGDRTQIAVSGSNAGTVYVLGERSTGSALEFIKTTNSFNSTTVISQPDDDDTAQRMVNDFTGGQAFYDLMIEVDPTDDNTVYVGGINIFKTTDGGSNWDQRSHWYGGFGHQEAHADQHAAAFGNGDSSKMLFANDGGVYYSGDAGVTISHRNKDYNTMQFYKGSIGSEVSSEKLLAGAQDNGTQLINNAGAGVNGSTEIAGGDGAYVFIDKDNEYMISSYVYNVYRKHNYETGVYESQIVNNDDDGDFINPAALDSENDFLYTNGSNGSNYRIYRYGLGFFSSSATLSNALLTRAPTAFKASTFTTTTLFVGTADGKVLKIENASTNPSWTDISGPDFYGSVSCIELGETENDIYVTFYNYGVINIFHSTDGGTTWQIKEGNFPDIPVRAIMPNPLNDDEVIIGTDLGVWASPNFNDATPSWYQSQNGMKDVIVTSFDLRTADNTVLASTYGRGMFTGQFTAEASGLSVDEYDQNNLIKIYPTVSNGNVTISSISDVREGELKVFDINGKMVHSSKVNFNSGLEQSLSLNLASGMYIAKFSANNLQSTQKLVIK